MYRISTVNKISLCLAVSERAMVCLMVWEPVYDVSGMAAVPTGLAPAEPFLKPEKSFALHRSMNT